MGEILDITDDDLKKTFMAGVANLAAVCLEIGYPTIASVPHSVVNGMKNLLAIAAVTDITFKEAEMIKEYLADPRKFAAAAAAPQLVMLRPQQLPLLLPPRRNLRMRRVTTWE